MTAWLCLLLAGALEIVWALGLKQSDGFTRLWPSLGTVATIALSFALMAVALKSVPFGTAYAIWTGIGTAGTVALGIFMFGEPADAARLHGARLPWRSPTLSLFPSRKSSFFFL